MQQEYEIVVGLEVHVELLTKSKIFCTCPTTFGAEPNTQVCPTCLGLPGTLPVLNREVLHLALKAGLALNCTIARESKFDRKNYFYPDLPKAYQISQFDMPIATAGHLTITVNETSKTIGLTRIHMEEDAGKLVHLGGTGQIGDAVGSLVDYNRAGVPLIEIVSEPDLRSGEEAYAYLTALKEILQYTAISDCNMEEGSLRCDANISVRPSGQTGLGTKTEIKNMNSFKNVRAAIDYEGGRQIKVLRDGGAIRQETRLWDPDKAVTVPMRSKEEAHDYRYFPEPDLPLIEVSDAMLNQAKLELPELPRAKRTRFMTDYGLSAYDAGVLASTRVLADYFEEALAAGSPPKAVSNWLTVELLGRLNAEGKGIAEAPLKPKQLAELVDHVEKGTISGKIGKQVFTEMLATGEDAGTIIARHGLVQISDPETLAKIIDGVMAAQSDAVNEYRAGKDQALGFLVGQVMKASRGQANPKLVNQLLRKKMAGTGTDHEKQ